MTAPDSPATIRVHDLLHRCVYDADGNKVGRIQEFVAERRGDALRLTGVILGTGGLLDRFGWTTGRRGRMVAWKDIATLAPEITLRPGTERSRKA